MRERAGLFWGLLCAAALAQPAAAARHPAALPAVMEDYDRIPPEQWRPERAWAECRSSPELVASMGSYWQYPELAAQSAATLLAPSRPVGPRLVRQNIPNAPVAAATWRADGRIFAGVTTGGEAFVWNRDGEIIDRRELQISGILPTLVLIDRDYIRVRYWDPAQADGIEETCWRIGSSRKDRKLSLSGWKFPPYPMPRSIRNLSKTGRQEAIEAVADRSFHVTAPDRRLAVRVKDGVPTMVDAGNRRAVPMFRTYRQPIASRQNLQIDSNSFGVVASDAFLSPDFAHIGWIEQREDETAAIVDFDLDHASFTSTAVPEGLKNSTAFGWLDDKVFGLSSSPRDLSEELHSLIDRKVGYVENFVFGVNLGTKDKPHPRLDLSNKDKYHWFNELNRVTPDLKKFWLFSDLGTNSIAITLAGKHTPGSSFNMFLEDTSMSLSGIFRLYLVPGTDRFFAVTNEGLYDTNLPPDVDLFRWVLPEMPDRMGRSYAPQTFMRDYFQPDLMAKLIACGRQGKNRLQCFPDVPDVTKLNRVLPVVRIASVSPVQSDGTVTVTVTASSTTDPGAPAGQQTSGLYDLRLFLDDRLIAEPKPADPALDPKDYEGWRRATFLSDGSFTQSFKVRLPTIHPTDTKLRLSAYAFNYDRIKSETATVTMARSPLPPGRSRLWLLAIGINDYGGVGFQSLRYAAPDAQAIIDRVKAAAERTGRRFGDRDIIDASLTGRVTKAEIEAAFRSLAAAGPDDVVLISYSGHGFTDARGRFFLVPSDGALEPGTNSPVGLISAAELSAWLGPVNAAETSMIIDACHSAASVSANGFKPGPMGEPGLGQLAFDKGIRILAASAPEQVAMEQRALGHGLLTYAFAEEAIGQGKAAPGRAATSIAAAMRYAAERVPVLGEPAASDALPPLLVSDDAPPAVVIQRPRLFDFRQDDGVLAFAAPATAGTPAASGTALH